MKNAIAIQDELIQKLSKYDPKGYNYESLITRAARKARRELMDAGFDITAADNLIADCHQMVLLLRAINREPVVKATIAHA